MLSFHIYSDVLANETETLKKYDFSVYNKTELSPEDRQMIADLRSQLDSLSSLMYSTMGATKDSPVLLGCNGFGNIYLAIKKGNIAGLPKKSLSFLVSDLDVYAFQKVAPSLSSKSLAEVKNRLIDIAPEVLAGIIGDVDPLMELGGEAHILLKDFAKFVCFAGVMSGKL